MTGTVAPHEGRELSLILSGAKDFAVIEKAKDSAAYYDAGAIEIPGISVEYREPENGPEVIVSRKRSKIAEYDALLLDGMERLGRKAYHFAMGRLFGYSDADIAAFIGSDISCNCDKCTGGNHK